MALEGRELSRNFTNFHERLRTNGHFMPCQRPAAKININGMVAKGFMNGPQCLPLVATGYRRPPTVPNHHQWTRATIWLALKPLKNRPHVVENKLLGISVQ